MFLILDPGNRTRAVWVASQRNGSAMAVIKLYSDKRATFSNRGNWQGK